MRNRSTPNCVYKKVLKRDLTDDGQTPIILNPVVDVANHRRFSFPRFLQSLSAGSPPQTQPVENKK